MTRPVVRTGPWLLSSTQPDLAAHRARYGALPRLSADQLLAIAESAEVLGRGGAGFPFSTKLAATLRRRSLRRHVVVNLSEGEPASSKDAALAQVAPHLVLDGAAIAALALGTREVHLVVPGELDWVAQCIDDALRERRAAGEQRPRWRVHRANARFVSGEASAVTELIDGRSNLPVTSWVPTAEAGVRGQPTLLSNAETFAQVAAVVLAGDRVPGPAVEPGTRLLTVTRGDRAEVVEVAHGTPWSAILSPAELARPVLLGGFHGQWAAPGLLHHCTISATSLQSAGLRLGAGVVIPLPEDVCPLAWTNRILGYLAGQSAGRCGPCRNGLPTLADAFGDLVAGRSGPSVTQLTALVRGRGACAHPDGTARLVDSTLRTFAAEVDFHLAGRCSAAPAHAPIRTQRSA